MILCTIIRTSDPWAAAVNRRIARRTDLEVGESVEVDLRRIRGIALANRLDFARALLEFRIAAAVDEAVGEAKRGRVLLVAVGEVHRGEEGERLVLRLEFWDGEVGG